MTVSTELTISEVNQLRGEIFGLVDPQTQKSVQYGLVHLSNISGSLGMNLQRIGSECEKITDAFQKTQKLALQKIYGDDVDFAQNFTTSRKILSKEKAPAVLNIMDDGPTIKIINNQTYHVFGDEYYTKETEGNNLIWLGTLVDNPNFEVAEKALIELAESKEKLTHYSLSEAILDKIVWNEQPTEKTPHAKAVPIPYIFFKLLTPIEEKKD